MKIFVDKSQAQERYNLCKNCDSYEPITTICKECGCVTKMKVKFSSSICPLNKW